MSETEDLKDRLKTLEVKVDDVLKELYDLANVVRGLEDQRGKAEDTKKRTEWSLFWQGLLIGMLGGILGDLFVSYTIKSFEFLSIPSWVYLPSAIVLSAGIIVLAIIVWTLSKTPPPPQSFAS
jgi:H+/Cl- antiporter ClcA